MDNYSGRSPSRRSNTGAQEAMASGTVPVLDVPQPVLSSPQVYWRKWWFGIGAVFTVLLLLFFLIPNRGQHATALTAGIPVATATSEAIITPVVTAVTSTDGTTPTPVAPTAIPQTGGGAVIRQPPYHHARRQLRCLLRRRACLLNVSTSPIFV